MTADEYVDGVEFALRDLPWRQRRELLADLRTHLAELPDGTDLVARLGRPASYAADLRTSAGIHQRHGAIAFIRSFRPLYVVFAATGLVALGLLIAAVAWVDSYQPLDFGNVSWGTPGSKPDVGDAGEHVAFRQGGLFEEGISVVNYGRFTVRVLGITGEYGHSFAELPLSNRRLTVAGPMPNRGQGTGAFRLFHPFDLEPGQLMLLKLTGTYHAHCRPNLGQDFWAVSGFQVSYRFLWRTGTAQIDLPTNLQINGPKNEYCGTGPPPS